VCVFGCGGDRDKGKRPIMGRIAGTLANHVIVTDDNPRSERPETIRAEILAGAPARARSATAPRRSGRQRAARPRRSAADRRQGHETGQIVGSTVLPFSDHEAVRAASAETPINV
jgi:UDP-N-acetylmuramoyl-L-alanyl-D-glutamate--2,6-diaminopimelate ligase